MQMGYNTDVDHRGITVHVQTEDHGLSAKKITTQVFCSGRILDSRTVSYAEAVAAIIDEDTQGSEITKRMRAIHKHFLNRIREGNYDAKLPIDGQAPTETPAATKTVAAPERSLTTELEVFDLLNEEVDEVLLDGAPTLDANTRAWRGLDDDFNTSLAGVLRKALGI